MSSNGPRLDFSTSNLTDPTLGAQAALRGVGDIMRNVDASRARADDVRRAEARQKVLDQRYKAEQRRQQKWHDEQKDYQDKVWGHQIQLENEKKAQEALLTKALGFKAPDEVEKTVHVGATPAKAGTANVIAAAKKQNEIIAAARATMENEGFVDSANLFASIYDEKMKALDPTQYATVTPKGKLAIMKDKKDHPALYYGSQMFGDRLVDSKFEDSVNNPTKEMLKEHPEWYNVDTKGAEQEIWQQSRDESGLSGLEKKYMGLQDTDVSAIPVVEPKAATEAHDEVKKVKADWAARHKAAKNYITSLPGMNGSTAIKALAAWEKANPKPAQATFDQKLKLAKFKKEVADDDAARVAFKKQFPKADPAIASNKESRQAYLVYKKSLKSGKGGSMPLVTGIYEMLTKPKDGGDFEEAQAWLSRNADKIAKMSKTEQKVLLAKIKAGYANESSMDPSDYIGGTAWTDLGLKDL